MRAASKACSPRRSCLATVPARLDVGLSYRSTGLAVAVDAPRAPAASAATSVCLRVMRGIAAPCGAGNETASRSAPALAASLQCADSPVQRPLHADTVGTEQPWNSG